MKRDFSYTADATSKVSERLGELMKDQTRRLDSTRIERLERVQKKVDSLNSKGLLRKQKYVSVSTADFERLIYKSRSS